MNAKRLALVAAVFTLLVIAVFVYQSSSEKLPSAAPVVSSPPPRAVGQPMVPPQPKPLVLAMPATPNQRDRVAPINERWGQMQPSNDLITAFMHHEELRLTKEEMESLLTAYLEVGRERSYYEAAIATVQVISPTERTITIPPYPEEGMKLQAKLYEKFAKVLGAERGAQVQAAIAPTLYARNYGFGETEQQVKVRLLDGEPISYYFVHKTGTLHIADKGQVITVQYGGMGSTHMIEDLGSYVGYLNLLPGGGS
jgi:hypothetical protein